MHIEVTSTTFYKIFEENPTKIDKTETTEKAYFYNKEADQGGMRILNYASSKKHQYYLRDINA